MRPSILAFFLTCSSQLVGLAHAAADRPRCRILLTDDDGVRAAGLRAAYDSLSQLCDVVISAPAVDRSGASHAVFNTHGTKVTAIVLEGGVAAWSVDGSPAEAAAVGLLSHAEGGKFDLLVSGINRGENLGLTNLYSGTVNAAVEGALRGVPSVAVSLQGGKDYAFAARFTRNLAEEALRRGIPQGTALNVNIPAGVPRGVKVVQAGGQPALFEGFDAEPQANDLTVYRARIRPASPAQMSGDVAAFAEGWITITPLSVDRTDYHAMRRLKSWHLQSGR